ncbi:hypothetical protein VTN02DRAFT_2349 [Thermoascus thermophilus]
MRAHTRRRSGKGQPPLAGMNPPPGGQVITLNGYRMIPSAGTAGVMALRTRCSTGKETPDVSLTARIASGIGVRCLSWRSHELRRHGKTVGPRLHWAT